MARTKGMLNLSGNLEVNAGAPLDARSVVPTVADLTVASNFQYKYVGMPVVVQATGDMYILTANDVTVAANWKQVGSGGGGSSYTAGDGIDITNDEISVKAGSNLSFDSSGNLNATDTTYTAGTGIDITNNVISATGGGGTSYTAGDGIDITNNVISVDEMASADMAEIVTPLPSVGARLPILFDEQGEERVVGWYRYSNGTKKPVYEKYFTNTIGAINSWKTVITLGTTCVIIDFDAYVYGSQSILVKSGFSSGGTTFDGIANFDGASKVNGKLSLFTSDAAMESKSCYGIVQYTKTTDTPV